MKLKVYLDNCCYSRPYDDQTQIRIHLETQAKMFIQKEIEDGKIILVASSFLLDENNKKSDEAVKKHIQDYIVANMSIFVEEGKDNSLWYLAKMIENEGIRCMDAAHLASAICSKCDYFITTDDRILKYKTDRIRIRNPIGFITEER